MVTVRVTITRIHLFNVSLLVEVALHRMFITHKLSYGVTVSYSRIIQIQLSSRVKITSLEVGKRFNHGNCVEIINTR